MSRRVRSVRTVTSLVLLVAASSLGACAGVALEARPDQIPQLEQAVERSPRDIDAATRLGVAYFAAERFDDARKALQAVVDRGSRDGAAYLYLGLANEELEDWTAARAAYDRYLELGSSARVKGEIRGRLALVARKEMRQQARLAIQQERVLSEQEPTKGTIAILPFHVSGLSEDLHPLQTALADMIITDLSLTKLKSLERVRVQSLVDEMVLAQAGFTTDQSGARMGRMLKAEHVVQGVLSGNESQLVVDASVVNTAADSRERELNRRGGANTIFDLEKQIVFDVLDALDHTITEGEREAIMSNRTGSLVAFLAYGRGLEALDRGNYAEAMSQFQQSAAADPSFNAARVQQTEAQQLNEASNTAPDQIGESGIVEIDAPDVPTLAQDIVNQVNFSPASAVETQNPGTPPQTNPNPAAEQQTTPPLIQAAKAILNFRIPNPGSGGGK